MFQLTIDQAYNNVIEGFFVIEGLIYRKSKNFYFWYFTFENHIRVKMCNVLKHRI